MKLLLCRDCHDVFKLDYAARRCKCGKVSGWYLSDGYTAKYSGKDSAVPLGFKNSSLLAAMNNQPEDGWGEVFEAFVIPKACPTMKQLDG